MNKINNFIYIVILFHTNCIYSLSCLQNFTWNQLKQSHTAVDVKEITNLQNTVLPSKTTYNT